MGLRRPLALVALVTFAALAPLAGCASGATTAAEPSATPAATATSAPRTLYQADWAQRASEWTLPPHWSIVDGKLENDGKGFNTIEIPYQVTSQSYTVNLQIRLIAINGSGYNNQYTLQAKTPAGALLYTAGVSTLDQQNHGFSLLYPSQPDATLASDAFATADFTPGTNSRSYVTQIDGPYITFSLGGSDIGQVKSAAPLAPARLDLIVQTVQLEVQSLTITTP